MVSGTLKYIQTTLKNEVPPEMKPYFPFRFAASGLVGRGINNVQQYSRPILHHHTESYSSTPQCRTRYLLKERQEDSADGEEVDENERTIHRLLVVHWYSSTRTGRKQDIQDPSEHGQECKAEALKSAKERLLALRIRNQE